MKIVGFEGYIPTAQLQTRSGTVVSLVLDPQVRATRLLQRALGVDEGVARPNAASLGEPVAAVPAAAASASNTSRTSWTST